MELTISLDILEYVIIPFISREVTSTIIFHKNWNYTKKQFDKWFLNILYQQHWFDEVTIHDVFKNIMKESEFASNLEPFINKKYKFLYSIFKIKKSSDIYYRYVYANNKSDKNIQFSHHYIKAYNSFVSISRMDYVIFGFKYDKYYYIYYINNTIYNYTYNSKSMSDYNYIIYMLLHSIRSYNEYTIIQILKTESVHEFIQHEYTKKNYHIKI